MFYSTYARVIVGLSGAFVGLIKEHSRHGQSKQAPILPITILSESQFKQALSHPQNQSLKGLIGTGYRDSIDATHNLNNSQESLEDQRIFIEESLKTLQSKLSGNISPASKANIEITKEALNQQLRVMQNIQKETDKAETQLVTVNENIDKLAQSHDDEWSKYRDKYLEKLRDEINKVLKEAGLPEVASGPGGEIDNLMRQDLQEVIDRFTDLGASKDLSPAEMEKMIGLNNPNYDTYFKMKAYLALRSVNPPLEQRAKLMKKLDSIFEQAKNEGQQINDKQQAETAALDRDVKPIAEGAKSNYKELTKLEQDRNVLLTRVASIEDLETIRVKIEQRTEIKPQAGPDFHP